MQHQFKIVFLGDDEVGKTTFMNRHLTGIFTKEYTPTLGVEVNYIEFNTNYGMLRFNTWDTAENPTLSSFYYVGADAAILFFDLTRKSTYKSLEKWNEKFKKAVGPKPIVVCGNKCDLPNNKQARTITFHIKNNCKYYSISSQSNYNFEKPFLYLARVLTGHDDLVFIETPPTRPPCYDDELKKHIMFASTIPLPSEDE